MQVIELAKNILQFKTLAIGDGYNDTQMLEAAHCGIRIRSQVPGVGKPDQYG